MNSFTFEQVKKKAVDNGLWDNMSEADRKLSESNPDAGMSLVNYRLDWRNATTDDARALAHAGAENIRKIYGNYSAGPGGNSYYVGEKTYESTPAPSFTDDYAAAEQALMQKITDRAPYEGGYDALRNRLADSLTQSFSESNRPEEDADYSAYIKQYRREGDRALNDTLGALSAATAGMPSTAAVNAANQAGQYYAERLADKLPELKAKATEGNSAKQTALLNALSAVNALDDSAYKRYLDNLNYNYSDLDALMALDAFRYGKQQDNLTRYYNDRDFNYNRFLDERNYNAAVNEALREQQNYTDAAALEQAQAEKEEQWNKALYAWEYFGDATLLKQLLAGS